MGAEPLKTLKSIDIDLEGWVQFPDLPTMRGGMFYDENEYMTPQARADLELENKARWENFKRMLARDIPLPRAYSQPKLIHLITEYAHENMAQVARELKRNGSIITLEPNIDYRERSNREDMMKSSKKPMSTPDWPSMGIAGSEDPCG
jgi:hypothetical protein